jgi:hypothetical protein
LRIKPLLIRLHWIISSQFGFDIKVTIRAILGLPRFLRDLIRFRSSYKGILEIVPCLHDWYEEGGATKNEYFWLDLIVARMINEKNPEKHVDIGSRIDGFVAHIASFREIEVFDVRPVHTTIPGIIFKQMDFSNPLEEMQSYCDSLSCLHALEHFGLGRYGDALNMRGYEVALQNIAQILKKEGSFYLSVPVGIERVEFNANRVFNPNTIIKIALENSLQLNSIAAIHSSGGFNTLDMNEKCLSELANTSYTLVLFVFVKL